ncbi:M20/M25/M40 family metallo-hydrolase [Geomicrobium sp. JSM 1781026]|uniref:M20/M25/M40 family metallo-hydrolase n=1 Tax=Geomicrobium sp. JSM 1781026 TaxID=3344580 RepID=UPI0035BF6C5E
MNRCLKNLYDHLPVQEGLSFLKDNHNRTLDEQIKLTEIPAPPFKEKLRASYMIQAFENYGLEDVEQDVEGNVTGLYRGSSDHPLLVVSAHMDTVFSEGTDTTVRRDKERLYAPGIFDDTRGLAEMLSIIRALQKSQVQTDGSILFVATVGEEGIGNLRGVKALFDHRSDICGFISIDGTNVGRLVYEATGSRRYKIEYTATGGHSYGDFGLPSATHAAGRAIATIADHKLPAQPKTTFTVGEIHGGTAINAIASSAHFLLDMRSTSIAALDTLESEVLDACRRAAEQENFHWEAGDDVKVDITCIGERPAGSQSQSATIVQIAAEAGRLVGIKPIFHGSGSTDSNVPIHLGIPAVTVGRGGEGGSTHTLNEWFAPEKAYAGPQRTFLAMLALIGILGTSDPMLSSRNDASMISQNE